MDDDDLDTKIPDRQDPIGAGAGALVWALTPARLVGHWVMDVALWGAAPVFPMLAVIQQHPDDAFGFGFAVVSVVVAIGFGAVVVVFAARQVRAGTALWVDTATSTVTIFRAAGRPLPTTLNRIERIDRGGRLDTRSPHSPLSGFPPLRLVAADGAVYLSPLLGPPIEIADALRSHNPRIQIDL